MRVVTLPDRATLPNLSVYDSARAGFRIEVPERFNPVIDIVEKWAAEDPRALAVVSISAEGRIVAEQTTANLALESRRAARALLHARGGQGWPGVPKGDRVLVMLPRIPTAGRWPSAATVPVNRPCCRRFQPMNL